MSLSFVTDALLLLFKVVNSRRLRAAGLVGREGEKQ
jgi:hypothetical protein